MRTIGTRNSELATRLCATALVVATAFAEVAAQNPPTTQPPVVQPGRGGGGGGRGGRGGIRILTLTSTAFTDGAMIPNKFAQPGRDVSPQLSWSGAPDSVVSYVLIVHDVDAASGNGLDDALHWMVWNIPGAAVGLPEGIRQGPQVAAVVTAPVAGTNLGGGGFGAGIRQISVSGPYYRGPAAPSTGPAHHYVFELYALDANVNVQPVGMSTAETREAVLEAMKGHVRAKGVLVGLYRRAEPPQP